MASSSTGRRTRPRKTIRATQDYLSPQAGAVPAEERCNLVFVANSLWRSSCDLYLQSGAKAWPANCLIRSNSPPCFSNRSCVQAYVVFHTLLYILWIRFSHTTLASCDFSRTQCRNVFCDLLCVCPRFFSPAWAPLREQQELGGQAGGTRAGGRGMNQPEPEWLREEYEERGRGLQRSADEEGGRGSWDLRGGTWSKYLIPFLNVGLKPSIQAQEKKYHTQRGTFQRACLRSQ